MYKNVASQKWIVFAFDLTDNTAKTGDAANITANLRIDGGAANAVDDTNPTELEDGYYVFDLTQAETNGDLIVICPASSTENIQVIGVPGAVWTTVNTIADWVDGGRLDLLLDAIKERTDNLPDDPADDSDIDGQLSTIAGYIDTEVSAIKDVTDNLPDAGAFTALSETITAIKERTDNLPDDPADDSDIDTHLSDIAGYVDTEITSIENKIDVIDTVVDAIKVVTDALTAPAAAKLATSAGTIVSGTVSHDNTAATVSIFYSDDIVEATERHYVGRIIIFISGELQYQARDITDYCLEAGEGKFTVTSFTDAPGDDDQFIIV